VKLIIGIVVSFIIGAGCRYFDIPVPSPPILPGALLVLAMTGGYATTSKLLDSRGRLATTSHLCGGPTGATASDAKADHLPAAAAIQKNQAISNGIGDYRHEQRNRYQHHR